MSDPITFAPATPTHKTREIIKSEWRTLFTRSESFRFREVVKNIDGDLSFLPNAAMLDVMCGLENVEELTWRELLTLSIDEWNDATLLNVNDPRVIASTMTLGVLGVLDDMSRVPVLLEGIPL